VPGIKSGLGDINVIRGQSTELIVHTNTVCDGTWFKDGQQVQYVYVSSFTWYTSGSR